MARPRDPDLDVRILEAVRRLVDEHGPDVTIGAVADAAGVSRPTIYRRWPTRAELLFAAQTHASVPRPIPDTGSLRTDLISAAQHLAGVMEVADRRFTAQQCARMIADPDFADVVWSRRWRPDREAVYVIWERAIERGEVDETVDGRAVIDDLVAIFLFRINFGHEHLVPADVRAVVDRLLDGVGGVRASAGVEDDPPQRVGDE